MKKRSPAGGLFSDSLCSAAAAAEYDDECKNDDQGAVIVKKMAKAVVHGKVLLAANAAFVSIAEPRALQYHTMRKGVLCHTP